MKQELMECQWHKLDQMQIIRTSSPCHSTLTSWMLFLMPNHVTSAEAIQSTQVKQNVQQLVLSAAVTWASCDNAQTSSSNL